MKYKKLLLSGMFLLCFGLSGIMAQEVLSASGGNATGTGGSISYTVGQIIYTTQKGANSNSIAHGVQQPYEITVVTSIAQAININLELSAYPNPITDCLTIAVKNYETTNLYYRLYDVNGKLLQTVKAEGNKTEIITRHLIPSIYFVKVIDKEKEIKLFKIIKNK